MYTKTASEIIKNALYFGQVRNSDITDFSILTSMLNDEYRSLYDDLALYNLAYTKEVEFEAEPNKLYPLPTDLYEIVAVYYKLPDGRRELVDKSPNKQYLNGTYSLENNSLKFNNYQTTNIILKYVVEPPTLTAQDKPIEIPNLAKFHTGARSFYVMFIVGDILYYVTDTVDNVLNGEYYKYNITTGEHTDTLEKFTPPYDMPQSNAFGYATVHFMGRNLSTDHVEGKIFDADTFEEYTMFGSDVELVWVSGPYMFIVTNKGRIKFCSGWNAPVYWNPYVSENKTMANLPYNSFTINSVFGFDHNDMTGKGVVIGTYNSKSKDLVYKLYSFVPDTVVSFPSHTMFRVIEYKLAAAIMSVLGLNNDYLTGVLIPQAQQDFYNTMMTDEHAPIRITNRTGRIRRVF